MDTELDALLERPRTFSAFANYARHLGTSADLAAVVALAQRTLTDSDIRAVTIFDDATGDYTELEPHGNADSVRSRLAPPEELQRLGGHLLPDGPGLVASVVSGLQRRPDLFPDLQADLQPLEELQSAADGYRYLRELGQRSGVSWSSISAR